MSKAAYWSQLISESPLGAAKTFYHLLLEKGVLDFRFVYRQFADSSVIFGDSKPML